MRDLDIVLLRAFVAVADAGGFTAAGTRLHRTQSTVSQQIRKLEEQVGRRLFERTARSLELTEDGERLLGHARRILALSSEAAGLFAGPTTEVVRIGVPEDYAVDHLPLLLGRFTQARPEVRLHVECDLSVRLMDALDAGDMDLVLVKQFHDDRPALAEWTEPLHWYGGSGAPPPDGAVPLVVFPQGCVYRNLAVHELEKAGLPWRVVYSSPSLAGVQAAVRAGLGVSVLSPSALGPDMRRLDGLPPLPSSRLVLYGRKRLGPGARAAADLLADSLNTRRGNAAA